MVKKKLVDPKSGQDFKKKVVKKPVATKKPAAAKKLVLPKTPLFMMAQLPFNTEEAVKLNTPMIEIMNDGVNVVVAKSNLVELGVLKDVLSNQKTFLEIGCGSGYLLEDFYKEGEGLYLGLEPIASEAKKAQKRLHSYFLKNKEKMKSFAKKGVLKSKKVAKSTEKDIKKVKFSETSLVSQCLLEEALYPESSIDYIYSYHVFEHLVNPLVMFEKANLWLAKSGKLIITCPNVESVAAKRLEEWRCSLSSHRWLPGVSTLTRAAKNCGFSVESCFTYGGNPAPRTALQEAQNKLYKVMKKGDVLCMMLQKK